MLKAEKRRMSTQALQDIYTISFLRLKDYI